MFVAVFGLCVGFIPSLAKNSLFSLRKEFVLMLPTQLPNIDK